MARLPTKANLSAPASMRSGRPIASFDTTALGRGIASAGADIASLGEDIERRQNAVDVARAEAYKTEQFLKTQNEFEQDPEYQTFSERAPKKTSEIVQNGADIIRDPVMRERWEAGAMGDAARVNDTIVDHGRKLQTQAETVAFDESLEANRRVYVDPSTNEEAKERARADIEGAIAAGQESGLLTPEQADARRQTYLEDADYNRGLLEAERDPASISRPLPAEVSDRASDAMSFFMSQGWSKAQAAGIVGNLIGESNLDPDARNPGDGQDGTDSIGLGQWNSERARALKAYAGERGLDWRDYGVQLAFVQHELETSESGAAGALKNAENIDEATAAFVGYERPQGWSSSNPRGAHNYEGRLKFAGMAAGEEVNPDWYQRLSPERQAKIRQTAQAAQSANDSLFRADLERTANDAIAAVTTVGRYEGALPGIQDFRAAYGRDGERRYQEFVREMETGRAVSDMNTMSSADIIETVKASRPTDAGPGFAAAQERHETLTEAGRRVIKQRNESPASYVATHFPSVSRAWENASDGPSMQRAAKASLDMQKELGIPKENRRIMTDSMVTSIANEFGDQEEGGQDAAQFMQGLKTQWGDMWPQVFSEMSDELPASVMVVGSMDRTDQAKGAEELSEAIKVGRDGYEKLIPSTSRTDIKDAVMERLPEFAQTTFPTTGGEFTTNAVRESMELLAMRYVTRGDDASRAVERAYDDIIGKAYNFQAGYRVPKDLDQDAVWWGSRQALSSIDDVENIDLPVSVQGLEDDDRREAYLSILRSQGFWATAGDESGLMLYDGNSTVTVDGEPLIYTWEELASRSSPEQRGIPGISEMEVSP